MSAPTPQATVTPTVSQVITALGNFIVAQLGIAATQVVQGYGNRTAMPTPASAGFVVMTPSARREPRVPVPRARSPPEV